MSFNDIFSDTHGKEWERAFNSKKSGKYNKERLVNASSKEYEANAVKVYLQMSDCGTKPVKIMDYMSAAHIGYKRAKRIIGVYSRVA